MRIEEIKSLLPHRYPFLLVDRVLELGEKNIVAIKNVTSNEEFFNGHFPGAAVMPGVLQVEALAQAGCLLTLKNKIDNPDEVIIVFSGIKNARFRRPVVPGDQLRLEVELVSSRRNFLTMGGKATVDGDMACEIEATAAIVPKDKL
ncbi:3-hydroxyacyl-ACP dehydratase FabZ [Natronogracilivirga saccharolytica]|uniref:3-hydroxyacyl-[acyl-carrier-protein] dehydratase FabZ n=1 Tax=Natronogracilivirga saccharolytica TaxID=2812953 RepID=A0A8J7S6G8_9BACT|nr:3-hydroxyacyl-ACP dehydratase FabZ [Natronogracilivirga saccharolytica]MBP3191051.1 3-hydroxyacyl-ACP dehydratase FabZ [Natronogracilivirga saccharolytica]